MATTPLAAVTSGDNIYDNGRQRGSSSSCTIPMSRKCSFCAKAYHERDRCLVRDAICYSCKKRGHFSRACRSRLGSKCSGKLSTFSASATPSLCVAAACPGDRGGARHFHLGGPLEGPVLQQGELSMVCVGLSERDLHQWHDVTRKILGGPGKI